MFRTFRTAALSVILGLGALAAAPAGAQAEGLYFSFGSGPHLGFHYSHGGPRDHRWHRGPWYGHACTPHRAVKKARRMGLRHAHVTHVGYRYIRVSGHRHHRYAMVTFARAPHCPIVRVL
ncbi:hypothetical protein [Chelativorans intermedius]|uniref:Antifreeze protein n=1 Tax=Chelativorans intermedius TaxID=515947 RepID=A0ABV6D8B0_9HYPH|nr:hypothetical protein [Chelativorans intermedius]MCT8996813.1 hypothetical protein [Chelativorans intermedius]